MPEGRRALFTWVGQRDPLWIDSRRPHKGQGGGEVNGPIVSLLSATNLPTIDHLYLYLHPR